MAKYLVQASYSAEGLRGLAKENASGRKAAVQSAVKAAKGKLEAMYFCFGEHDVMLIVDLPDNASAAAISLAAGASGMVRLSTTPLLTVDEVDQALALPSKYRAPGQ